MRCLALFISRASTSLAASDLDAPFGTQLALLIRLGGFAFECKADVAVP
jgi:hypothetical protein